MRIDMTFYRTEDGRVSGSVSLGESTTLEQDRQEIIEAGGTEIPISHVSQEDDPGSSADSARAGILAIHYLESEVGIVGGTTLEVLATEIFRAGMEYQKSL